MASKTAVNNQPGRTKPARRRAAVCRAPSTSAIAGCDVSAVSEIASTRRSS